MCACEYEKERKGKERDLTPWMHVEVSSGVCVVGERERRLPLFVCVFVCRLSVRLDVCVSGT